MNDSLRFSTNNERTSNAIFPTTRGRHFLSSYVISVGILSFKIHETWTPLFVFAAVCVTDGYSNNNICKKFIGENKGIIENESGYLLIGFSNHQEMFMNCYRTKSTSNAVLQYNC